MKHPSQTYQKGIIEGYHDAGLEHENEPDTTEEGLEKYAGKVAASREDVHYGKQEWANGFVEGWRKRRGN